VRDEEPEIAKVLDFGVAKVRETGLEGDTKTGALLGTPFYMSPEQARASKDIDHRSDLWSLAVLVYQCLTGRLPFVGDGLYELLTLIVTAPLPIPSQVAPVPPSFDAWWARAAARDRSQRFQSAKELTDALGPALGVIVPEGMEVGMGTPELAARSADPSQPIVPLTPPGPVPPPPDARMADGQAPVLPGRHVSVANALTPSGASIPAHPVAPPAAPRAIGAHAAPRSWRGVAVGAVALAALGLGAIALRVWSGRVGGVGASTPTVASTSASAIANLAATATAPAKGPATATVTPGAVATSPPTTATGPAAAVPTATPTTTATQKTAPAARPGALHLDAPKAKPPHDPWAREH
jgi:serine/threonine-protein kinase